ncbi:MAG: LamG domain-containing protein [Verrucomicrobiota bacterium]
MNFTKYAHKVFLLITGLGLAVNGYSQSFLTNGLVAYYPFNRNANDMAGTNDGVPSGATLTVDRFGNANSAYLFNGTNSFIQTVHPMQDMTTATFCIWFNAETTDATSDNPALLSDSDTAGGNDCIIQLIHQGSTHGIFIAANKNIAWSNQAVITNGIANFTQSITNNWLHFVWVMTPTEQTVYVNGTEVAALSISGNDVGYHSAGLVMGAADLWTPWRGFYSGKIDDVRIYNRALSGNEVQQLYAFESLPIIALAASTNTVTPSFSNLYLRTNYQLQVSSDLNTWTNQGSPFTPTNTVMAYPQYFDVLNWNRLFFRLQLSP